MRLRWLAAPAALLVLIVARAPASLLADRLQEASGGRLLLAAPSGTLWSGSGELWLADPGRQSGRPWLPVRWRFAWEGLAAGEVRIDLGTGSRTLARVFADTRGFGLGDADLALPADFALAALPGPLGGAGWRGNLRLQSPAWRCRWAEPDDCVGRARLTWHGAAAALLPWPELGDYELDAEAGGRRVGLVLRTLAGPLKAEGSGAWEADRGVNFAATLRGDPLLLSRLPGIASGVAQATGDPGTYRVVIGGGGR